MCRNYILCEKNVQNLPKNIQKVYESNDNVKKGVLLFDVHKNNKEIGDYLTQPPLK